MVLDRNLQTTHQRPSHLSEVKVGVVRGFVFAAAAEPDQGEDPACCRERRRAQPGREEHELAAEPVPAVPLPRAVLSSGGARLAHRSESPTGFGATTTGGCSRRTEATTRLASIGMSSRIYRRQSRPGSWIR